MKVKLQLVCYPPHLYQGHTSSAATSLMLAPVRPETGMNAMSDDHVRGAEGRGEERGGETKRDNLVLSEL